MKKLSLVLTAAIMMLTMTASAQFFANKVKLTSGDLAFLKGAKELNIAFDYQTMKVGEMDEADYIIKHQAELEKAKTGSGETWKKKWNEDRPNRYEPAFLKTFVKRISKLGITAGKDKASAKYTLTVKVTRMEPGVYTGISVVQKDAFIDAVLVFTETGSTTPLAEVTCTYMKGSETYDLGARITYAYLSTGNITGAYIVSTVKKIK